MAATAALFRKELRQHGLALLVVTLLLAAIFLIGMVSQGAEARVLSALEMVPRFAVMALPVAMLYLGHRLVVVEYYGRTQRFVEALPLRRGHLAVVKALFGLTWVLAWALAALLLTVFAARRSEVIESRFLLVMAARLSLFVFAVWGVVFVFGFFGRLRIPLAIAGGLLLFAVDRNSAFDFMSFGPLVLIDPSSFPFERQLFPTGALLQSAAVGTIAFSVALALTRVREGSIVEALARKLSTREASALLAMLAGGIALYSSLTEDPPSPPYRLTTDKVVRGSTGAVQVAYLDDDLHGPAVALLAQLEARLQATSQLLAVPAWPNVQIVQAPERPVDRPEVAGSGPTGLVVRANLRDLKPIDQANLVFVVIHRVIWDRTRGRAGSEPRHWLLDGFAWNVAVYGEIAPQDTDLVDLTLVRALAAAEQVPFGASTLAAYHQTTEILGDDLSNALASSGWRTLVRMAGTERARALARRSLAYIGTGDVRDTVHDWLHPLPKLIQQNTDQTWDRFVQSWSQDLQRWRKLPAAVSALNDLPRATLVARSVGGVGVKGGLQKPLGFDTTCVLRHLRLPPFDAEFSPDRLEEAGFLLSQGSLAIDRVVEGTYGRGERAFVALDCEVPALAGSLRLFAARVTVR